MSLPTSAPLPMNVSQISQRLRAGTSTTPGRLQAALVLIGVGAAILWLVTYVCVSEIYSEVKTIGIDSVPSIIAAQKIRADLADMDANAANELVGKPGENMPSVKDYEDKRREVAASLISAAQNITYGDEELKPILTLAEGFSEYEGWVTQARDFHVRGDAAMLAAYRHATRLMHDTLLPAADKLDAANFKHLDDAYSRSRVAAIFVQFAIFVTTALLFCLLIYTQLFVSKRFNRIINVPLAIGTVLLLLSSALSMLALARCNANLKVAKADAFDSVHKLWMARAEAYDANGEESRWLLDRPLAQEYEKAFFEKSDKIAKIPGGQSFESAAAKEAGGQTAQGFAGYLADELNNITFDHEREAAVETLKTYGVYYGIDGQIRQKERQGDHAGAVALCIGINPGESNWAFQQFDDALVKTLKINMDQFTEHKASAFGDIAALPYIAPIVALLIAILAQIGLKPRLREYSS